MRNNILVGSGSNTGHPISHKVNVRRENVNLSILSEKAKHNATNSFIMRLTATQSRLALLQSLLDKIQEIWI